MKKIFPKVTKLVIGICFFILTASFIIHEIRQYNIKKIENEISKMISGEIFAEVQYEDYADRLKLYSKKPISKASLGTVYNRLSYMCGQDGDWLGYYSNFGKAVYYLEESGNYNDEINLYCDLIYYIYFANGDFDLAKETMQKIDFLIQKCHNLDNQAEALVYQRYAQLDYYINDYKKALIDAEKSKAVVKNVDAMYAESFYNAAQFVIAKVNIQNNDYALAEELIEANKDSPVFEFADGVSMINTNFFIPYYQLLAYVSTHNNDEETIRFCVNQIIDRAYKYDFEYAVSDTLGILRQNNQFSENLNTWLYEQELQANKEFITKKSKTYSSICNALIDNNRDEISKKEIDHANYMRFGHLIMTLVFAVILLAIFSFIFRNSMYTDGLTGVYNRRAFDKRIKKNNQLLKNYSVIMIDIDDFKKVNDTFGHSEGDIVLQKIGLILLNRSEPRKIVPYRYGGEEFAILIYDDNLSKSVEIAESLRYQIECQNWNKMNKITISAGVAKTVDKADENLYIAKNNGKNQVV